MYIIPTSERYLMTKEEARNKYPNDEIYFIIALTEYENEDISYDVKGVVVATVNFSEINFDRTDLNNELRKYPKNQYDLILLHGEYSYRSTNIVTKL